MSKVKFLFKKRQQRIRAKLKKVSKLNSIRLSIYRSNNHIYAQLINDQVGNTVTSASTLDKEILSSIISGKTSNVKAAREVGLKIAQNAKNHKIEVVIFDKGGYKYHGRIKALAEAAREGGLKF